MVYNMYVLSQAFSQFLTCLQHYVLIRERAYTYKKIILSRKHEWPSLIFCDVKCAYLMQNCGKTFK